jgi:hypothetical protein
MSDEGDGDAGPAKAPKAARRTSTTAKPRSRATRGTRGGWTATRLGVAAFVVIALAGIGLAAWTLSPARMCLALLPTEARTGVVVSSADAGSKVDITASTVSKGAQSALQSSGFLQCLLIQKDVETVDRNQAAVGQLSTLGQVADQWQRDTGAFRIVVATADPVLANFEFLPDQGHKADLMSRWCRRNEGCVTCEPDPRSEDATSVVVRLKARAAVASEPMPADAAWRTSAAPPAYMLVVDGVRYDYACRAGMH